MNREPIGPTITLSFAISNRVAADIAVEATDPWRPDVVHANNWHCGLLPLFLCSMPERPNQITKLRRGSAISETLEF